MANIINPAVAVAAQGGGKNIHNITIEGNVVVQYVSEQSEPFTLLSFYSELMQKGFTSQNSLYPAWGVTSEYHISPTSTFSYIIGIYAASNDINILGRFFGGSKSIDYFPVETTDEYVTFTDIVL